MQYPLSKLPTDAQKRIDLLDILRGFAVFGIFVVNIEIMNCVFLNQDAFSGQWTSGIDRLSVRIMQLFFYSKFFPIFSFLFGVGISMQALRRMEKGVSSSGFFIRRMGFLFLIGVLHVLLLWSGDVLHLYALLGLMTALLLKRSSKFILAAAVFLLLFPFYEELSGFIFERIGFQPESFLAAYSSQEIIDTIRSGSYVEGVLFRLREWVTNIPLLFVFLAPVALAMFLLGLYFGKKQIFLSIDEFINKTKKPALAIALFTTAYRLFFLFVLLNMNIMSDQALRPVFLKFMYLSDVVTGLLYLWLIAWLWKFPVWKKLLAPLQYVGRMALTNYIMHSLIGLILFSSVGFQRYETLSPAETLITATLVFCFQLIFSNLWLSYFYYGPLEWLWRCFSYKKLLPIRRARLPRIAQNLQP